MKILNDDTLGAFLTLLFPESDNRAEGYHFYKKINLHDVKKWNELPMLLESSKKDGDFFTIKYWVYGKALKQILISLIAKVRSSNAPVFGSRGGTYEQRHQHEENLQAILNRLPEGGDYLTLKEFLQLSPHSDAQRFIFFEISVSSPQKEKLESHLKEYISLYESRDLDGQSGYSAADRYYQPFLTRIQSAEFLNEYTAKKAPLLGGLSTMFSHSIFLLDHIQEIKLLTYEPVILEPTKNASGAQRKFQWKTSFNVLTKVDVQAPDQQYVVNIKLIEDETKATYIFPMGQQMIFKKGKDGTSYQLTLLQQLFASPNGRLRNSEVQGLDANQVKTARNGLQNKIAGDGLDDILHVFSKSEGETWLVVADLNKKAFTITQSS